MNRKRKIIVLALIALLLAVGLAGAILRDAVPAAAQTSPSYNLEWHVVAGGGGVASSVSYRVSGVIGQALSGESSPSSTNYRVEGGFEGGGGFSILRGIYLPQVLKGAR